MEWWTVNISKKARVTISHTYNSDTVIWMVPITIRASSSLMNFFFFLSFFLQPHFSVSPKYEYRELVKCYTIWPYRRKRIQFPKYIETAHSLHTHHTFSPPVTRTHHQFNPQVASSRITFVIRTHLYKNNWTWAARVRAEGTVVSEKKKKAHLKIYVIAEALQIWSILFGKNKKPCNECHIFVKKKNT